MTPPATIVVGDVVRLRGALAWYDRLPLFGRRVLVTRAASQAGELLRALRAAGAEPIAVPLLRVVPCEDTRALDEALSDLGRYDALLLTSANAARLFAARASQRGVDLGAAQLDVVCVGPATAAAAREAGLAVRLVPSERFDAEGLLSAIRRDASPEGRRFLLPRSAAARDALPDGLRALGARVDTVAIYRPEPAAVDAAGLRAALVAGRVDALTFTSPSSVRHFLAQLDPAARAAAGRIVVAAIGPVTEAALREAGLAPQVVAPRAGATELVEALAGHFASRGDRT
jgi:uroporphyrinogen III methyltransferase/synthase